MLEVNHVNVRFGEHIVVNDVSFSLKEGQWLMLVGPNGAGKSTLINVVSQGVSCEGTILLRGKDIRAYRPVELARQIGVLSQQHQIGYAYSVQEVVSLGRYAYRKGMFAGRDDQCDQFVDHALELTGMETMRSRKMTELSGGEIQRVFLAQVFAQNPDILLLDEPANHLDLQYQKQIFSLIGDWLKQPGRAVVSVVHDLSLARRYGTDALLMHHGKVISHGEIGAVLTERNLETVYEMDVYGWMREMLSQWLIHD